MYVVFLLSYHPILPDIYLIEGHHHQFTHTHPDTKFSTLHPGIFSHVLNCPSRTQVAAMLFCVGCGGRMHLGCVDPPLEAAPSSLRLGWRCAHCKVCETCRSAGEAVFATVGSALLMRLNSRHVRPAGNPGCTTFPAAWLIRDSSYYYAPWSLHLLCA